MGDKKSADMISLHVSYMYSYLYLYTNSLEDTQFCVVCFIIWPVSAICICIASGLILDELNVLWFGVILFQNYT